MNKIKSGAKKVGQFLRKNIYYVLIFCCVAAIATMFTVAMVQQNRDETPVINQKPDLDDNNDDNQNQDGNNDNDDNDNNDNDNDEQTPPQKITFINPVEDAVVGKEFSMDALVWSSTLKQYMTHSGVDFMAEEGTAVVAVYGGTVESVTNDTLNGLTVTVNHGNGLKTIYGSLGESKAEVGQTLTQGQQIGTVSDSCLAESADGSHLHFEVNLNGEITDPYEYLTVSEK